MKNLLSQPRTTAQIVLLHSIESAGLSALITIIVATLQYVSTHGLNWVGLLAFLGTSFVAQMAMVYKSLSANPQTARALADTAQQIEARIAPSNQPGWPPIVHVDVPQLAATLKDELVKLAQNQPSTQGQVATPLPVQAQPGGVTTPLTAVKPGTSLPPSGAGATNWTL